MRDNRLDQPLTPREQEVLEWVGRGCRGRDIAARMGIAYGTLRKHRLSILAKTGLRTSGQLAALAVAACPTEARVHFDLRAGGRD